MTVSAIENGVRVHTLNDERLPLVLDGRAQKLSLAEWAREHRTWIEGKTTEYGAVLFRNFRLFDPFTEFQEFSKVMTEGLLEYIYRSTPRTAIGKNIYTATEYPAGVTIPQHNENAYSRDWPLSLMFLSAQVAQQGGETPLSKTASITRCISAGTREKFRRRGVLYVRNYHERLDLSWREVFQTDSKQAVESFCTKNDIQFEWRANGTLRTRQVCQGMAVHPKTGEELWFNQAHLFHVSSLDQATRKALLAVFKEDELPRSAYYGDGSALEPEVLDEIRAAFDRATIAFPWQVNDVLLLDNMLVGHGRRPFHGPRKVLVAMGRPYSSYFQTQAARAPAAEPTSH